MMMMMVLCPKAGSLAFTPPGDEMSEVVSRCLPHRQLRVSNLSKVVTQWREVDSNLRPFGCKAQNLPLHHGVPYLTTSIYLTLRRTHKTIWEVVNFSVWVEVDCIFLQLYSFKRIKH